MRRRTTTKQLNSAITNNLLHIKKAEVHYKTSGKTEIIDTDRFIENFSFLCESGVFSDAVGWHFERDIKANGYIAVDSGAMNPYSENVVTVYLRVGNDVDVEDIERTLLFWEEE